MTRRFVGQLADGDSVEDVFLVTDKQLRANRNGNLYLQLELRDRTGSISGRLWNVAEPVFRSFEVGDFLQIKGKVQLFQGALQMILSHMERSDSNQVNLADFLPHTEHDIGKLQERLRGFLLRLSNPHLRALAECFLIDEEFLNAFSQVPAGVRNHHAYLGGLLEHVVTLLDAADRVLPLYPNVDRDLLLTGVFLHDIGKVRELSYAKAFAYTDEGQLIGHIVIGVEMLAEKAAKVPDLTGEPFPTELLLAAQAHDPEPSRHLRIRRRPPADDARGHRPALPGQPRREDPQLHPRHPRGPQPVVGVDALQPVDPAAAVQGFDGWKRADVFVAARSGGLRTCRAMPDRNVWPSKPDLFGGPDIPVWPLGTGFPTPCVPPGGWLPSFLSDG